MMILQGCSALLPSGRKKRDTGTGTGTGTVGSEVIEASTSFIIRPSDETGSTDTGSGTTGMSLALFESSYSCNII